MQTKQLSNGLTVCVVGVRHDVQQYNVKSGWFQQYYPGGTSIQPVPPGTWQLIITNVAAQLTEEQCLPLAEYAISRVLKENKKSYSYKEKTLGFWNYQNENKPFKTAKQWLLSLLSSLGASPEVSVILISKSIK